MVEMLRDEHDPTGFARAEETIAAIIGGASFDALVVDAVLPGMSGPELIRELECTGHAMNAVVVTGYAPDELDLADVDAIVLTKPFRIDELLRALDPTQPRASVWRGSSASIAREGQSAQPS